jgi:hypothetical protein
MRARVCAGAVIITVSSMGISRHVCGDKKLHARTLYQATIRRYATVKTLSASERIMRCKCVCKMHYFSSHDRQTRSINGVLPPA